MNSYIVLFQNSLFHNYTEVQVWAPSMDKARIAATPCVGPLDAYLMVRELVDPKYIY